MYNAPVVLMTSRHSGLMMAEVTSVQEFIWRGGTQLLHAEPLQSEGKQEGSTGRRGPQRVSARHGRTLLR